MEFLLEIFTEEMPPSHVKAALSQLDNKFKDELSSNDIDAKKVEVYGTCRRLIIFGDIAPKQRDREEELIGPPKAVAFKDDGSPASAAKGFAQSQGVKVSNLKIIKTNKGEYLGIRRIEKGRPAQDILSEILPSMVSSLSFPKMMRWGKSPFRFSRPIKNILCIFNERPLSFSVAGIISGNSTCGHKLHSPKIIKVKTFREYKAALKKMKVVVNQEERQRMILSQIERKLAPLNAEYYPDEELLERTSYDVEYPYVFLGAFPEDYLDLPIEVLSTAMREGQRLFSVVKNKKQLPFFLGVADGYRDVKSLIQKGNERVLKARLEDAKFFWAQDRKTGLKGCAKKLGRIVFHEKLGSYEDKTQRLKKIVAYLADKIDAQKVKKQVVQGAEFSKVDLLTDMVREFPSLQGKMGGLYAREEGHPAPVWRAIYEHYQPVGLDDESPSSLAGSILSISDKLDSIVGAVGIGIRVTGSKDPLGLRRNALGICKIVLDKKLDFPFSRLLDKVMDVYGSKIREPETQVKEYCLEFFSGRLRYIYEKQGYRYDLINAAISAGIDNIYHSFLRVKALDSLKDSPNFEPLILIFKRIKNILRDQLPYRVNSGFFVEKDERELHAAFGIIQDNVLPLIKKGDFSQAQKIIFRIRTPINSFFDNVLVMAEEKKIRQNRLALLQGIHKLLLQVADYSQIVIEGQNSSE